MEQTGAQREPEGADREQKGAKREPKGVKREPNESQRVPKGAKSKVHPNIDLGTKVDIGEARGPKRSSKGAKMDAKT